MVECAEMQKIKQNNLSMTMSLLLLSSFAFATNTLYAQSYYKWVDAQGSTHYTKTPPPRGAKKQGKVDTYSSTPTTSTRPSNNMPPATNTATSLSGNNLSNASTPAIPSEPIKQDVNDRSNPSVKTPNRTSSSNTF